LDDLWKKIFCNNMCSIINNRIWSHNFKRRMYLTNIQNFDF